MSNADVYTLLEFNNFISEFNAKLNSSSQDADPQMFITGAQSTVSNLCSLLSTLIIKYHTDFFNIPNTGNL